MSVKSELLKLESMVKYANVLVKKSGVAEQKRRGLLDWRVDTENFKELLYVANIFADFNGDDGVTYNTRNLLFKRFNKKLEYITLLDPLEDDNVHPDYLTYETKPCIDNCEAITKLKRRVRAMIKEPSNYWRVA